MNDYLFLKISEMALRAIERPRRGLWVYYTNVDDSYIYYDTYPYHVKKGRYLIYLKFPNGTRYYDPHLNEIEVSNEILNAYADGCGEL